MFSCISWTCYINEGATNPSHFYAVAYLYSQTPLRAHDWKVNTKGRRRRKKRRNGGRTENTSPHGRPLSTSAFTTAEEVGAMTSFRDDERHGSSTTQNPLCLLSRWWTSWVLYYPEPLVSQQAVELQEVWARGSYWVNISDGLTTGYTEMCPSCFLFDDCQQMDYSLS
jgi:hypothetical protein